MSKSRRRKIKLENEVSIFTFLPYFTNTIVRTGSPLYGAVEIINNIRWLESAIFADSIKHDIM